MSDFLSNGEVWLNEVRKESLATSRTLTYRRTGEADIDLTDGGVVVGAYSEQLETETGMSLTIELREFIVPYELIDFGSGAVEPEPGDRMLETFDSGNTATFASASSAGQPSWSWHDTERTAYRIRMQQVSA